MQESDTCICDPPPTCSTCVCVLYTICSLTRTCSLHQYAVYRKRRVSLYIERAHDRMCSLTSAQENVFSCKLTRDVQRLLH